VTRRRPFVHDSEPPPKLAPDDRVGRAEFARLARRLRAEAAVDDPVLAEALRRRRARPWRDRGRVIDPDKT
jgi:hypothetical protein